jgi:hypothetical protein
VQRRVLDALALKVLQGEFREGDHITVDATNGVIVFRTGVPEPAGTL